MALVSSDYDELKKGDKAPSFELKGIDDEKHKLSELKGDKLTLIVFVCNHCPYVIPKIHELNRIYNDFKDKGLNVIGVNSNNNPEYPADSFENMKKMNVDFSYLFDETQDIARLYGAVCTPDPFLFDKDLKLIFHSRIDDAHGSEDADEHEMYDAVKEYMEKGQISKKENPSMGCSIKWVN